MTGKVTHRRKVGPHIFLSASPPSPVLRLLLGGQGLGRSAEQGGWEGWPPEGLPLLSTPAFLPHPRYCWTGSQSISRCVSPRSAREARSHGSLIPHPQQAHTPPPPPPSLRLLAIPITHFSWRSPNHSPSPCTRLPRADPSHGQVERSHTESDTGPCLPLQYLSVPP